ncbi:clasp N terminal-domain-containing protein [Chytriomyces cf. hyalinus JEL632]|nr:clasp N terminal-domain-containing protein [Chytriomyces cf. hyalinus JEL632]
MEVSVSNVLSAFSKEEDESSWGAMDKSLSAVAAVLDQPSFTMFAYVEQLKRIKHCLAQSLHSPRSALQKTTISLLCTAARTLGTAFAPLAVDILPVVLSLCAKASIVMVRLAATALGDIVASCSTGVSSFAVVCLVELRKGAKTSKPLRIVAVDCVRSVVCTFATRGISETSKMVETVHEVLRLAISDSANEVRDAGRRLFSDYSEIVGPERLERFISTLPPQLQKSLHIKPATKSFTSTVEINRAKLEFRRKQELEFQRAQELLQLKKLQQQQQQYHQQSQYQDWNSESQSIRSVSPTASLSRVVSPGTTHPHVPLPSASSIPTPSGSFPIHPQLISTSRTPSGRSNRTSWILPSSHTMDDEDLLQDDTSSLLDGEAPPLFSLDDFEDSSDLYAATATESLFGAISYNIPLSSGRTASIHTSMSRELGGSARGNGSILTDDTVESENGSNGEPGVNTSHAVNGTETGSGVPMERIRSSRRHNGEENSGGNAQSNLVENQKLEAAQDEEIANLVAEIRLLEQQEGISREWQKEQRHRGRSRSSRLSSTGSLPRGIEMPPVGGVTLDMEFAAAATVPRTANELYENDEDEVSVELDPEYLRMTAGYEDVETLDGFVEGSASFEETDSRVHAVVSVTASSEILDTATATPTILAECTDAVGKIPVEEASCVGDNNSAVNPSETETPSQVMSKDSAEIKNVEVQVIEAKVPEAIMDSEESGRRDSDSRSARESIQTLSDNAHELVISQAGTQTPSLETGNDNQNDDAFDETKEETDRMNLEPVVILCSAATSEDGGEAEVYETLAIQVVEVDGDEQVPTELETNLANTDAEAIMADSNAANQVTVADTIETDEQQEIPAVQTEPIDIIDSAVPIDELDTPQPAPGVGLDASTEDVKSKEVASEIPTDQGEVERDAAESPSAPAHSAPFGTEGRLDSGAILDEGLDLHKTTASTKESDSLEADAANNQGKSVESSNVPEAASSAAETGISLTEAPKMAPVLPPPVLVSSVSVEDGNAVTLLKGIVSPVSANSDDSTSTTLQSSAAELSQSHAVNLPSQESRNTKSPQPPSAMRTSFLPMMTRQKSNSRPIRPDVQQLQSVPEPPRLAKTASVGRQSTLPKPASISSPTPISSLRRSSVSTNPSQSRKLPAASSPSKKSGMSPPTMFRTPSVTPSPSPPGMRRQGTNGKSSTGPLSSTVTPRAQVSKTASSIAISSSKSGSRSSNDTQNTTVKQTPTSAGGGLRRAISTSVIPTVATSSSKLAQGTALRTALTSPSKSKSLGVPNSASSPQRSVRPSTTAAALSPTPNRLNSKPQLVISSSARNLNRVKSPTNSAESSSSRGSSSGITGNQTVVSPTSPVLSPNESERTDVSSRNSTGAVPDRRSVVISPSGKRSVVSPTGRPSPPVYRHLRPAPPSASSSEPVIPESTIQAAQSSVDGVAVPSIPLIRSKSVSWHAEISTVMGYSDADEGAFSVANQLGDAIIQGVEGIWSFCESYSNGVGSEAWGMDAVLSRLEDIVNAVVKDLNQSLGKKRDAVHIKHGLGILKSSLDVAGMERIGVSGTDGEVKATIPENCLESLVRCALALSAAAEGTDDNLEIEYEVSNVIEAFESRLPFPTIISVVANILKLISSAVATQPTSEVSEQRCCFEILARVLDTTVVTGRSSRPSSFVKTTPANESVDELDLAGSFKQESVNEVATALVDWDSLTVLVAEGLESKHPLTRKSAFDCAVALCRRRGSTVELYQHVLEKSGRSRQIVLKGMLERRLRV